MNYDELSGGYNPLLLRQKKKQWYIKMTIKGNTLYSRNLGVSFEICKDCQAQRYINNDDDDAMLARIQLLCLQDYFSSEERKNKTLQRWNTDNHMDDSVQIW
jgi:hypothetical protein